MKLEEAIKSGRRFKPSDSEFDDWSYGWLKVGRFTKSVEDERNYQVRMFTGWFDWDWELEPEVLTKQGTEEGRLEYLEARKQILVDAISRDVEDVVNDLAGEIHENDSRLTTLEVCESVNSDMIEDLLIKFKKLDRRVQQNDEDQDTMFSDIEDLKEAVNLLKGEV